MTTMRPPSIKAEDLYLLRTRTHVTIDYYAEALDLDVYSTQSVLTIT